MNLNKIIKQLLITMTVLASLGLAFTALSQQPSEFLAQTFPGQYKPTDKDKIRLINNLANNRNNLFDSSSNRYAGELKQYITQRGSLPSISTAKELKSSLQWYRIMTGPWPWSINGPYKTSEFDCMFSHLSVDLVIDCYLNSQGAYDLQDKPYTTRLKAANPAQYNEIARARTDINNWVAWVRGVWEPSIIKQMK
jgi:hypothetical protein